MKTKRKGIIRTIILIAVILTMSISFMGCGRMHGYGGHHGMHGNNHTDYNNDMNQWNYFDRDTH